MTHHEFADLGKLLTNQQNPHLYDNEDESHGGLKLPNEFSMQAYIEPKLDGRYITYYSDETRDRLLTLRPDIKFEVTAKKFHEK
jgi:hypothetical protein